MKLATKPMSWTRLKYFPGSGTDLQRSRRSALNWIAYSVKGRDKGAEEGRSGGTAHSRPPELPQVMSARTIGKRGVDTSGRQCTGQIRMDQ